MRTNNIDFGNILKRDLAINSECSGENPICMYNIARESLKENKSTVNRDIENFFNNCRSIEYADKYYNNCLSLIESINDDIKDRVISIFSEEVIPYVKNLNSLKESVKYSNIDNDTKSILLNSIKENKICDRILSNDKMIKKRFNIENFIIENRYLPLENIVFECCSLLDTYDNIPSYGKMNIALEELSYYLQKQDINYDRSRFAELVMEYFLYRNDNIDTLTKNRYRNVLKENIMISDDDLSNIKYFVENEDYVDYYDIQKAIHNFNNSECKDLGSLKSELQNIFEKNPKSVIDHLNCLLETLRHLLVIGTFNFDSIQDILRYVPTRAMETNLDSEYMKKLVNIYRIELEVVEKQMNIVTGDKYTMMQNYHSCINDCISKIDDYFYRNSDYECRNTDKKLKDVISRTAPVVSLQEFKIFKFDNLIKATLKIDKFLRRKSVKITASLKDRVKKAFKVTKDFFNENTDIDDILKSGIITEDNSIDICLAIFEVNDDEIQNVNSLLEALCKDIYNHILSTINEELDVYYTNIGNTFELHLEDNIYLNLTEEQEEIRNNVLSERDVFYINRIMSVSECLEKISNIDIENIIPSCNRLIENCEDIEYIETIIEALSYVDIISYKDIVSLKESYSDIYPDNYRENTILNSVVEQYWNKDRNIDIPLEVQVEALQIVDELLQEANKKPVNKKPVNKSTANRKPVNNNIVNKKPAVKSDNNIKPNTNKKPVEKPKKEKIPIEQRLNDVKIGMMGLKKKAKDLSSKEQEMCRNLDATVNTLYRSMKQAVVSDRREAIIKGSIIPSFSKLIKIAIGLVGIGLVTQSIVYPIITAVVGLAISKNLTKKERSLLLDEIEIELKVVDKEIQMAENRGNMKNYRKLITFQKKLQREKSRIRYGLKVGRDLPDNPTNDY